MPILASLNAKNRSKSPFSIGMLFSIISDFTSLRYYVTSQVSVIITMTLQVSGIIMTLLQVSGIITLHLCQ